MESKRRVTPRTCIAVIPLLVGFVVGLVVAWIYWVRKEEGEPTEPAVPGPERVTLEPKLGSSVPEPGLEAEVEPDDLTRIAGIGPKMSSVLQTAGIVTFEQLAGSDVDVLKQLLREEGLQFADPGTWPEQAALAAAGAWEALDDLQRELSGGRRVGRPGRDVGQDVRST